MLDIAQYNSQTDTTTVVNHLVYDAFGRVTSETKPAVTSLFLCPVRSCRGERKAQSDHTARPYDSDSQLQNNLNRWYDARVGRWLSEDPVGFAAGDGNLYRYVANDPTVCLDSSGNLVRGVLIGGGFSFAAGGYIYVFCVSDHLGNAAVILAPRLALGAEVSIGAEGFLSQGTVPQFLKGFSVDISGGAGIIGGQVGYNPEAGWAGGVGIAIPWVPEWVFKAGGSVGVTPVVHVIWKNF